MAQHMAIPKKYTVSISVPQAARLLSLHEATLRYRMSKDGLTLEQAIALGPSKRPRIRVGQKFGHLTVAQVLPSVQGGNARVLAKCSCGAIKECLAMALKNGHVVRCGQCDLGRELHGKSNSASYGSWSSMRQRCSNPNRPDYPSYGGRGISVCPEWSKSFTAFLRDMGERPDGTTLERNDVNGNYEPDNCRWATYSDQSSNRRPYKHKAKYSRRSAGELPQS
jgi:hypothetical protein